MRECTCSFIMRFLRACTRFFASREDQAWWGSE